nr:hypothetical protein [uncultured Terrisporobacter sp.]
MEEIIKNIAEKISSYNIFTNFFPGIVFCYIVEQSTRFSLKHDNIWVNIFVYYFVGIIVNRFGSIFVEKWLMKIKVKNKETNKKEPFLKFAPYEKYIDASKNDSFVLTLNETNNTYRTMTAMIILAVVIKLYDWLLYDWVQYLGPMGNNLVFIIMCLMGIALFVFSYKKQTDYIRKRVESYNKTK